MHEVISFSGLFSPIVMAEREIYWLLFSYYVGEWYSYMDLKE